MINTLKKLVNRVQNYDFNLTEEELNILLSIDDNDLANIIKHLMSTDVEPFSVKELPRRITEFPDLVREEETMAGKIYYSLEAISKENSLLKSEVTFISLLDMLKG